MSRMDGFGMEKNRKTGFSLVGCKLFFLSEEYSYLFSLKIKNYNCLLLSQMFFFFV